MADDTKKDDQIKLLETCLHFSDTGEWKPLFSYPNAGWDLVQQGLVTEDKQITIAGRSALWFLGKCDDPTPKSKSYVEMIIPLAPAAGEKDKA